MFADRRLLQTSQAAFFLFQIFQLASPCPVEPAVANEGDDLMELAAVQERPVSLAHVDDGP